MMKAISRPIARKFWRPDLTSAHDLTTTSVRNNRCACAPCEKPPLLQNMPHSNSQMLCNDYMSGAFAISDIPAWIGNPYWGWTHSFQQRGRKQVQTFRKGGGTYTESRLQLFTDLAVLLVCCIWLCGA